LLDSLLQEMAIGLINLLCLGMWAANFVSATHRSEIKVCSALSLTSPGFQQPGEERFFNNTVIKGGKCAFQNKLVILGAQGAGKSSLANGFLGWDISITDPLPFPVGHGVQAGTLNSSYASGSWIGLAGSPGITVVDTPGFNDSVGQMEDLVWLLGEMEEVNAFVLVFRYKDRLSSDLANSIKSVGKLLGNMNANLAVVVSFWSFSQTGQADRDARRVTRKKYENQVSKMLQEVLETDIKVPVFFIDSHYKKSDEHERRMFYRETTSLWQFMQNVAAWESLPPAKLKAKVRRVRRRTGEIKEKCQVYEEDKVDWNQRTQNNTLIIEHQDQKIIAMRRSIDKLKTRCLKY